MPRAFYWPRRPRRGRPPVAHRVGHRAHEGRGQHLVVDAVRREDDIKKNRVPRPPGPASSRAPQRLRRRRCAERSLAARSRCAVYRSSVKLQPSVTAQAMPASPQPAPSSSTLRLRSGGSRGVRTREEHGAVPDDRAGLRRASVPIAPATPRRCAARSIGMTTRRPAPRSSSKVSAFGSTSGSSSPRARRPTRFASSPSDESSLGLELCGHFIDQCGDVLGAMHGQWQLGGSSEAPRAVRDSPG